ncbi:MAG: GWxTD domain-containing protein [bacterium]|nr:GWxTD domain-containing protein [Candidatus Kapabacteria bacterium]
MTPRLSDEVSGDVGGFFLFFEAYNAGSPIDIVLDAVFRDAKGVEAKRQSINKNIRSGRTQQWIRVQSDGLARGAFVLELRAVKADDSTRALAFTQRTVRIETGASGVPGDAAELDERIAQLRYVAMQSDIDLIRDAATFPDKRIRFADFWSRRDPTPGTRENEAMQEYYARIDYAQEHFRSYLAGWMTDQGRVYVVYGPPDNVTRDPFQSEARRLETWQYFSRGNLQVVFQDDSGFGDFRLVTPISQLEKYRYAH